MSLYPDDFDKRYEIINFFYSNNDLNNAEIFINQGIELNPNKEVYYDDLGFINYERKNYDLAILNFNKSILLKNEWFPNFMLAKIYALQNNIEFSIKFLDKSIELNKDVFKSFTKDPDFDKIRSKDVFKKYKKNIN